MTELFPDTLDDLIAEAERELKMRGRVYPRLVADGKLTQQDADTQVRRLRGIIGQLKADRLEKIGGTG